MIQVYPLQFVNIALSLGYMQKQLYPVSLQQLQQQSIMMTKGMSLKERQFYLQKKMIIYEARRQKILKQVDIQYKILQHKLYKFKKFNPKIKQILQKHEKSLRKTQRYNEVRSKASSRRQTHSNKNIIKNTVDLGRVSPTPSNRSSISRTSQTTRSLKSQVSNRSNRTLSSANSLTRSRFQEVKQKQKQVCETKRRILLQKQKQDQIKFLKAEENALNRSRKAKIRSQISHKIVKENKNQIDMIRNFGMKDHLQSLKFKIVKKNHDRQKHYKSISSAHNKDVELYFVNHVKNQIQHSTQLKKLNKYDEKTKNSLEWQNYYNSIKRQSLQFSHHQNQMKIKLANQRKSFQQKEEKKFREQVILFEKKKIIDAEKRRQEQKAKRKLNGISQQIRREIVNKNKKSLQSSHSMRKNHISQQYNEKIQEISYIQKLKEKLRSGQFDFTRTLDQQKLKVHQHTKLNGPRNSLTSGGNRQAYFNTILQ